MPAKKFSAELLQDPLREKVFAALRKIKHGYYYTKAEFAAEIGQKPETVNKWMPKYPEVKEYLVYMRLNGCRTPSLLIVSKSFKRQLLAKNLASERFQ